MKVLLLAALLAIAAPARADVKADASYVVETHVLLSDTFKRLDVLYDETVPALAESIRKMGGIIINEAAFTEELLGDFDEEMLDFTRTQFADLFQELFSPEEIKELADFFRSRDGKIWLDSLIHDHRLSGETSKYVNGPLAVYATHMGSVGARFSTIEAYMGTRLTELLALERIADILAMHSLVGFESEDHRRSVVEGMLAYSRN